MTRRFIRPSFQTGSDMQITNVPPNKHHIHSQFIFQNSSFTKNTTRNHSSNSKRTRQFKSTENKTAIKHTTSPKRTRPNRAVVINKKQIKRYGKIKWFKILKNANTKIFFVSSFLTSSLPRVHIRLSIPRLGSWEVGLGDVMKINHWELPFLNSMGWDTFI